MVQALTAGWGWLYYWRVSNLKRQQAIHESFAQRLIQSQESERQRIAADLHDSLGQKLLIIKNCAQFALSSESNMTRTDETREQLERVSAFASESLEEVRQIARNLRPYQLDQIGLTKAI